MLELKQVNAWYESIQAIHSINIHVDEGEIVCIIGANGAGKSTVLMTISRIVTNASGEIFFKDMPIHGMASEEIVRQGILQVPEGRRIFSNLSVQDNLDIGAYLQHDRVRASKDLQNIFDIFPALRERRKQRAGTLSGGEQQMLAISRALMARPTLLLLDEPSLGLAPLIIKDIFEVLQQLNKEQNTTILLVEQNANQALKIADRGYVLEAGTIVLSGNSDELLANSDVQKAYLGI